MEIEVTEIQELLQKAKDGKIAKSDLQSIKSIQSMLDQERNDYNSREKSKRDGIQAELDKVTTELDKFKKERMTEEERIKAEVERLKKEKEDIEKQNNENKINILKRATLDKEGISQEWIDSVNGKNEEQVLASVKSLKERLEKLGKNNNRTAGGTDREKEIVVDVDKKVNEKMAEWDEKTRALKEKIAKHDGFKSLYEYTKKRILKIEDKKND